MQNSVALEKKHIQDLSNRDNANANHLDNFYQQSMQLIAMHLNAFYDQYANDIGLNLNDVQKNVSKWDVNQYKLAINTLTNDINTNSWLSGKLKALQAQAMQNKRGTMNAIIGAGIAVATNKAQNYSINELPSQYINEYKYRMGQKPKSIPKSVQNNGQDAANRMQVRSDMAEIRAKQTLNQQLAKGMDKSQMKSMTEPLPRSAPRIDGNIASSANNVISTIQVTFKANAIKNTQEGQSDANNDTNGRYDYRTWQTERDDAVCDLCNSMDGVTYSVDETPVPQTDTHIGCRCDAPLSDADGNLAPVYP